MNIRPFVDSVTTPTQRNATTISCHFYVFHRFHISFFFFFNLDVFVCVVFVDGAVGRCVVIVDWISTQKINANPLTHSVSRGGCVCV